MPFKYLATAIVCALYLFLLAGSGGESSESRKKKLETLKSSAPVKVNTQELATMFSFGSDNTDLQRDAKEKELKGKVVQWRLEVYEVSARGDSCYRIQTSSTSRAPGTFIETCNADNPDAAAVIPALKTGDVITVKGIIDGTSMRHFDLDPAYIVTN